LASIDLESLKTEMAATIEKAKAEDPKHLMKTIVDLRLQLSKLKQEPVKTEVKTKEVFVIKDSQIDRLEKSIKHFNASVYKELLDAINSIVSNQSAIGSNQKHLFNPKVLEQRQREINKITQTSEIDSHVVKFKPGEEVMDLITKDMSGSGFGRCERQILKFLAMRHGHAYAKHQIGAMTGYSHGSGGFNNAISKLLTAGLIVRHGNLLQCQALESAVAILGKEYGGSDGNALEQWLQKLGKCAREIYQHLLSHPDEEFTKAQIAVATGYSEGSGGFNNALSQLNTLGLADRSTGRIRLAPDIKNL
jgi:hypothetical protein